MTTPKKASTVAPFSGFPKPGVAWFEALALAQNRDWFHANRAGYDLMWLAPMQSLLAELKAPLERLYGRKLGAPKVFRINRDVRFSNDKRPYKTNISGMLPLGSKTSTDGPAALYLQLGLDEMVAFGFYALEPASLLRLRRRLLDEKTGPVVAKLVDAAKQVGLSPSAVQTLKRPPPGVDKSHARVELLKHKGLALARSDIPKSVRFSAALLPWLVEQAKAAAPVVKWGFAQKL
jgi:uncharacterized protein (TIGR02453 family)